MARILIASPSIIKKYDLSVIVLVALNLVGLMRVNHQMTTNQKIRRLL